MARTAESRISRGCAAESRAGGSDKMPDAPITYRRATPGDRHAALRISAQFAYDWMVHGIDRMTEEGRFYVAEQGGRVVAVCGYHGLGDVVWLNAMRVDQEVHNRGIATAFTRYIMGECRKAGFRKARLDTEINNHPVHHLVREKLGFRPRGKFFAVEGPGDLPLLAGDPCGAGPGTIRTGFASDLEAAWAFLVQRVSGGHLALFDLAPCPEDGWEIGGFDPATLNRWIEKGYVLLAERPDRAERGDTCLSGLAVWRRTAFEAEESDSGEGAENEEPFVCVNVSYLEGEPPTQAALLASISERSRVPSPPDLLNIGLIESQWRTVWPLLDPSWVAGSEGLFEAVIYDKDLV